MCCVPRYGVGLCQRVQWQHCFGDKCSKDSYLVVRDDFCLSWTTGQTLLRTMVTVLRVTRWVPWCIEGRAPLMGLCPLYKQEPPTLHDYIV